MLIVISLIQSKSDVSIPQVLSPLAITAIIVSKSVYVLSQGSLKKFKPSKSSLEEVFGQQSPEMKKLMKAEKLNYKKENDLVSIFESYNGL